jgi:hypothetical protein
MLLDQLQLLIEAVVVAVELMVIQVARVVLD